MAKSNEPATSGTVDRAAIATALGVVVQAASRGEDIPVLAGVLLSFTTGELTIEATDLDHRMAVSIMATGLFGSCVVNAVLLKAAVDRLVGDKLEVAIGDGRLTLKGSNGGKRSLPTLPVDDFPPGGDVGGSELVFDRAKLITTLERVRPAISTDETRFYLGGIFVHAAGDGLRFAATDGHRLHVQEMALDEVGDWPPVIVPTAAITLLLAALAKADDEIVAVACDGREISFAFDTIVLRSRLIDGTYPDYSRVIPSSCDVVLTVAAPDVIRAVEAVAAMQTEKTRSVAFRLGAAGSQVEKSGVTGDAVEPIDKAELAGADELIVGFNAKYAVAGCKPFGDVPIHWRMSDAVAPTLIDSIEVPGLQVVLMPMRV